jgi:CrcB protein
VSLQGALAVAAGGCLGALLRYALIVGVQRVAPLAVFPHATLVANLAGCLAIGALAGIADARGDFAPTVRAFLFTGVLGGFTTFSSFGYETLVLARSGAGLHALANVLLHLGPGLALVWLGYALATRA